MKINRHRTYAFFVLFSVLVSGVSAQTIYTSDLDDGSNWTVVGDADTAHEFGFDYSPFGIPAAPNGTGTTGLWMAANITSGVASVISASPNDVSVSGQYSVQFDMWINFNTSGGTTEFGGGFVGFDSTGGPRSGAGILADSDGDSARDFRLYKDANEQFIDSGQYNPALTTNNGGLPNGADLDPLLLSTFPGQTTPAAQGDSNVFDPTNTIVTAGDGTLGFGWHEMTFNVDSDAGTAEFLIDGFSIGTVDSNIGDAVSLTGGIALTHADLFTSVASKPEFAFTVFDNVSVSQVPEPASSLLALTAFAALGLTRRRR